MLDWRFGQVSWWWCVQVPRIYSFFCFQKKFNFFDFGRLLFIPAYIPACCFRCHRILAWYLFMFFFFIIHFLSMTNVTTFFGIMDPARIVFLNNPCRS